MAEASYAARRETRAQVEDALGQLSLTKDSNDQYNFSNAATYLADFERVLKETFNTLDPGNGMAGLLISSTDDTAPSAISSIKPTDAATAATVLQASRNEASALGTMLLTPPAIASHGEAQDEANRISQANQVVIGAKEGATREIIAMVSNSITNEVLRTADGATYKGIDGYELCELVDAIKQGADCPHTNDILRQLVDVGKCIALKKK